MGDGRLSVPLGVYDEDELLCRTRRSGETGSPARPPVSLGLTGPGDHPVFDTPGPTGVNDHGASTAECRFVIDPVLRDYNKQVEKALLEAADNYYEAGDLRWFFAYAHGTISKLINANLELFQDPNALLKLNIHFSEAFIRAVDGDGPDLWKKAFRMCAALQKNELLLQGEVEMCGAAMANVHIFLDLQTALREVGCISADDYGNMLVFVNRGNLAALVRLRGRADGAAERMLQELVGPIIGLDVKAWRNAVFEAVCKKKVPEPTLKIPLVR
jgi:hypothetical protein